MADNKKLYFIPIITKALNSEAQERAMQEAFDEIGKLGKKPEYNEGFQQFQEFIHASLRLPGVRPEQKIQFIRNAIYNLIYDLAAGTFEGDRRQQDDLINALKKVPHWNEEYERIKKEARDFLSPDLPIEIEVLKGDKVIGSSPISSTPTSLRSISPGRYTVRFSNGRILWEGDLLREDLIWTYAFPGRDLPLAAETKSYRQKPTRSMTLLDGELIVNVYAGLESGEITLNSP